MFGREKDVAKKGMRTVDKVVTGIILGGVVASIYGIKKYEDSKHKTTSATTPKKRGIIARVFLKLLGRK